MSIKITSKGKEKIQEKLLSEGLKISANAKLELTRNGTVDTGQLRQSIQVTPSQKREGEVVVGSTLKYASTIEFGLIPEETREEDIKTWANRKLGLTEPELTPTTRRIVSKIRREGVEEQPFMRPAITKYKQNN